MTPHQRRAQARNLALQGRANARDVILGLLLYLLLTLAAVAGHAVISARVAHGEDMPPLFLEQFLPFVARED